MDGEEKNVSENKGAPKRKTAKTYPLQIIRGLPFPDLFLSITDIEKGLDFKPRDSDIFVVTYPKCGTTWTQFIVWEIINKGAPPPSPNQMMFSHFPFLEFCDIDHLDNIPPPRTIKTHLPFNLQPYNTKAKYIYIVRNPWDCCVSYYYHYRNDTLMPLLTFDDHFEQFITGQIAWGDYFDHVLSWFDHRNDPNVLFLTYEGMKKDTRKTVLGIAKFLGDSFYENVQNEEILQNCLKHSDFKYMKELGMFFPKGLDPGLSLPNLKDFFKKMGNVDRSAATEEEFTEVNFFRKGEVGDWKNHFSPSQIKKFNEYMLKKLKNTEMENFWQPLEEETAL